MNRYIKSALKVFSDYLISLLIFGIFLYVFFSITKENFPYWLPLYCFINFAFLFLILYSDMKTIAVKEKRPQYDMRPYPLKGFVLGLLGFSPFIILEIVYPFIVLNGDAANRIKQLAFHTLLGPLYGFIKLGGKTPVAYILATLAVPLIALLGYMSGYYGFDVGKYFKIFPQANAKGNSPKKS